MNEFSRRNFMRTTAGCAMAAPFLNLGSVFSMERELQVLSRKFTVERLASLLVPRESWHPYPTASDRDAWMAIPESIRTGQIERGEESLGFEWKPFLATDFLEMARTGSRAMYDQIRDPHRGALQDLVVAECVEGKGRFMDDIVNGIWATCEESFWGKPWHLDDTRHGPPYKVGARGPDLPDSMEPRVPLFVAETAAMLSWACYVLGSQLESYSERILPRVETEMERRILTPCLERTDYHWMGFPEGARADLHRVNNWNPWICSNWLTTVLLMDTDPDRRVAGVAKVFRCLDNFLDPYPRDGGCDEGPGYWNVVAGNLYTSFDLLHNATNGQANAFKDPLIGEIGRYIVRAQICDRYFLNYADAPPTSSPSPRVVYGFGKRFGDKDMMAMGSYFAHQRGRRLRGGIDGRLRGLFDENEALKEKGYQPLPRDVWFPDIQVASGRTRVRSCEGLYFAVKGGHNAESHNHNDVGSYLVYVDGKPVVVDPGRGSYTGQTFSERRYELWYMSSGYHSLPTVNGIMQAPGIEFAASDVTRATNDAGTTVSLDIGGTYPKEAHLKTWKRTVSFKRGKEVRVEDRYRLTQPGESVTLNFVTPCSVDLTENGRILLGEREMPPARRRGRTNDAAPRSTGSAEVLFDATKLIPSVEEITIEDRRMKRSWGALSRVVLSVKAPGTEGDLITRLRPIGT